MRYATVVTLPMNRREAVGCCYKWKRMPGNGGRTVATDSSQKEGIDDMGVYIFHSEI